MRSISLPLSKSMANRLLMLQAIHGDPLMEVSSSMSEDVQLMHHALSTILAAPKQEVLHLDLGNDGTAMRFLTAYAAQFQGLHLILNGCARMRERPIGQEVDALRAIGADIRYVEKEGFPPLEIIGRELDKTTPVVIHAPQSTQYISALLLIGATVETDCSSPYIDMTRSMIAHYPEAELERDWSAAAFWLERSLLTGETYTFPDLKEDSVQGDKAIRTMMAQISTCSTGTYTADFSSTPDLYPAVAMTCHERGIRLEATGVESLRIKECDRLAAMENNFRLIDEAKTKGEPVPVLSTYGDHRIAMALLAAGYRVDDEACVKKSYPDFCLQLRDIERIIPRRGINDEGKGKKWALHRLVPKAESEWLWLTDDDVIIPDLCPPQEILEQADMIILPLKMARAEKARAEKAVEVLQMLEYAAIQSLTIRAAQRHHAVMCSGANILVRKQIWLDCEAELHPEIPSGDDMFLLEAVKHRGLRVETIDTPELAATCYAHTSWKSLLRQRMRWAGKAAHYTDTDILLCGAWTVFANLMVVLCPAWAAAKWVIDMRHAQTYMQRYSPDVWCQRSRLQWWLWGLLLTLVYPLYMLICLLGGLKNNKRW